MPKLKDFITALAKKAGFDTESEAAKPFFAALPDTDMPDDIHRGIDNALISLAEAKNNHPEIKGVYQSQALNGIDQTILDLMKDFEVDEPTRAEILAEKSTYKRVPNLTRRLIELERKKAATTGGKDKAAIQEEINGLHAQLKAEKDARAQEKKEFEEQRMQDRMNVKKNVLYSGLKTIHDDLDSEVRYDIIDAQLRKELQDKQAKFAFDDHGNLIIIRNDGTNFFGENHQQIKPAQFIEQVLAKNKQLKVTDTSGSNGPKPPAQPPASGGNGKPEQSQTSLIEANKRAVAEFEAASKNGVFSGMI